MKIWRDSAPANIALVKYMGKSDATANAGTNPSLSFTLMDLRTEVEVEIISGSDIWQPLGDGAKIGEKAQARFLRFFKSLKDSNQIQESFVIRSRNNFPGDAGIASSASSFAALTRTAMTAFATIKGQAMPSALDLARTSRRGSGSSCRSFFSPWCGWDGQEDIWPIESELGPITDFVIAIDSSSKAVSSSDAHLRVAKSPLFEGRPTRASERMTKTIAALAANDWNTIATLAWAELWDMHSLFHTSTPPFFYFKPGTISVLEWSQYYWQANGTGPIVSIDAGPNVHLLVRSVEKEKYETLLRALCVEWNARLYISG
jgi:diphosphomevalonate decarboxylase